MVWTPTANIKGATGATGDTGPTGTAGVDGKTLRSGTGVPASGLGVAGDFYIDTSADTLYGPKVGTSWGSATSLVGPTGPAGSNATATTDASALTSGTLSTSRLPAVTSVIRTQAYAATITIDASVAGNLINVGTLTGNPTIAVPSGGTDRQQLELVLTSTSARTVTIAAGIRTSTGLTRTLALPANEYLVILLKRFGTAWVLVAATTSAV